MKNSGAILGVSDHGGWAVLVTVARDGVLLDRRRVELVDESLPKLPHHHDAQHLPIDEGVALVERVRASAQKHAAIALDAVAAAVPDIGCIALRQLQPLPPTIAERLQDYRSQNVADWVMYRQALAAAAEVRGWSIHWYDPKTLNPQALEAHFLRIRKAAGPPWNANHKLAMAAAVSIINTA